MHVHMSGSYTESPVFVCRNASYSRCIQTMSILTVWILAYYFLYEPVVREHDMRSLDEAPNEQQLFDSYIMHSASDCSFPYVLDAYGASDGNTSYYHHMACLIPLLLHNRKCLMSNSPAFRLMLYPSTWNYTSFIYETFSDNIVIRKETVPHLPTVCDATGNWQYSPLAFARLMSRSNSNADHDGDGDRNMYHLLQQHQHSFAVFVDFIKKKTRSRSHELMQPAKARNSNTRTFRVLILDRLHRRSIHNVESLANSIELNMAHSSVEIVYNERINYSQQVATISDGDYSCIISPHGANLMNLMYLPRHAVTTVIELCPPYTHCLCAETSVAGFRICPYFYYDRLKYYVNATYFAYAQEYQGVDCRRFCQLHSNHTSGLQVRGRIRDVRYINVSVPFFLRMLQHIRWHIQFQADIASRIYIDKLAPMLDSNMIV